MCQVKFFELLKYYIHLKKYKPIPESLHHEIIFYLEGMFKDIIKIFCISSIVDIRTCRSTDNKKASSLQTQHMTPRDCHLITEWQQKAHDSLFTIRLLMVGYIDLLFTLPFINPPLYLTWYLFHAVCAGFLSFVRF